MSFAGHNGDDFQRTGSNIALVSHTPTGPNAHASGSWVEFYRTSSVFGLVSHVSDYVQASASENNVGFGYYLRPAPSSDQDVRIRFVFKVEQTGSGTYPCNWFWRIQDADNFYMLKIYPDGLSNNFQVWERVSGTYNKLAEVSQTIATSTTIEIDMQGSAIVIRYNTSDILSTSSSQIADAGDMAWGLGAAPDESTDDISNLWRPDDIVFETQATVIPLDADQAMAARDFGERLPIGHYQQAGHPFRLAPSFFSVEWAHDLVSGALPLCFDFSAGHAQGWVVVDEGDIGAPSAWAVVDGVYTQTSNIGGGAFPENPGTMSYWESGVTLTDYDFLYTQRSDDDDKVGAVFRYTDQNNYYRFLWDKESNRRRLQKVVAGTWSLLHEDTTPYVEGQTYGIRIRANGSTLEVWIDGVQVIAETDSSLSAGTVGFYTNFNDNASFDDICIAPIVTVPDMSWWQPTSVPVRRPPQAIHTEVPVHVDFGSLPIPESSWQHLFPDFAKGTKRRPHLNPDYFWFVETPATPDPPDAIDFVPTRTVQIIPKKGLRNYLYQSVFPNPLPPPVYEQAGFRWRNDDGNESGATWMMAQNSSTSIPIGENIRLRVLIDSKNNAPPKKFVLEYKKSSAPETEWTDVPVPSLALNDDFVMALSDFIGSGGANTTAQLTPPTGKTTALFTTGRARDNKNPDILSIDLEENNYTEFEWCIEATTDATENTEYQFRVVVEDPVTAARLPFDNYLEPIVLGVAFAFESAYLSSYPDRVERLGPRIPAGNHYVEPITEMATDALTWLPVYVGETRTKRARPHLYPYESPVMGDDGIYVPTPPPPSPELAWGPELPLFARGTTRQAWLMPFIEWYPETGPDVPDPEEEGSGLPGGGGTEDSLSKYVRAG